jgi:acetyltransferase
MALIALVHEHDRDVQVGVARYIINADGESCEFAIVVSEAWQGRGLGHHLMQRLIDIARARGLKLMNGQVLAQNKNMLELVTTLGFVVDQTPQDHGVKEGKSRSRLSAFPIVLFQCEVR